MLSYFIKRFTFIIEVYQICYINYHVINTMQGWKIMGAWGKNSTKMNKKHPTDLTNVAKKMSLQNYTKSYDCCD